MRILRDYFILMVTACLIALPCYPSTDRTGTSAADYLKLCGGVRAAGMGEAFVAVADDSSAIYWNPAGMALFRSNEISSMYTSWFQGISLTNVSGVGWILGNRVGLSVTYLDMGVIEETTMAQPAGTGRKFTPNDTIVTFSHARKMLPGISVGASLKVINDTIDRSTVAGCALDCGVIFRTPVKGLNAGLVVKNLGSLGADNPLPFSTRMGMAYYFYNNKSLLLACDINIPNDDLVTLHTGVEFSVTDFLYLRFGINSRNEEMAGGNLSAGLGFSWDGLGIDYAYAPYGDLGEVHRASISIRF